MKKTKILYVDDDPIYIYLISRIMGGSDFDIVSASSAEHAISILKDEPELRIIISDWVMPGMDGLELVQYINNLYPDKICYMLSSSREIDEIKYFEKKGIIRKFFSKPVDKELLLQEMNNISNSLLIN